ncbi:MAG: cytochrome c oxidase assembly protein [Rhodospirillales bacterium]
MLQRRNLAVLAVTLSIVGAMVLMVSYSVTLYRLFCDATGLGGFTQRVEANTAAIGDRTVTVYFSTDVAPNLPWRFYPQQQKVEVRLGESVLVFFTAENLSDRDYVGHATFNVTPEKAGIYFNKIQCFCFDEEKLSAHQKVDMPVVFYIDPKLATDPGAANIDSITLAYTFFVSAQPDGAKDLARLKDEPLTADEGKLLFATNCAACHDAKRNKTGPALGNVVGRKAGTTPGFVYSSALAKSDITWTPELLDKWLTNPRAMVPSTKMPVRFADPKLRGNVIRYLQSLGSPQGAAAPSPAGDPKG